MLNILYIFKMTTKKNMTTKKPDIKIKKIKDIYDEIQIIEDKSNEENYADMDDKYTGLVYAYGHLYKTYKNIYMYKECKLIIDAILLHDGLMKLILEDSEEYGINIFTPNGGLDPDITSESLIESIEFTYAITSFDHFVYFVENSDIDINIIFQNLFPEKKDYLINKDSMKKNRAFLLKYKMYFRPETQKLIEHFNKIHELSDKYSALYYDSYDVSLYDECKTIIDTIILHNNLLNLMIESNNLSILLSTGCLNPAIATESLIKYINPKYAIKSFDHFVYFVENSNIDKNIIFEKLFILNIDDFFNEHKVDHNIFFLLQNKIYLRYKNLNTEFMEKLYSYSYNKYWWSCNLHIRSENGVLLYKYLCYISCIKNLEPMIPICEEYKENEEQLNLL